MIPRGCRRTGTTVRTVGGDEREETKGERDVKAKVQKKTKGTDDKRLKSVTDPP